ncbi:MAG: NAD(P)-binding domain-containing protein [Gaiellaceae bacterium]
MRRKTTSVQVAIVGGGPAGLAASSELARAGCSHVVLERERVGWSWRAQRWDAFRLNTPTWANRVVHKLLPGTPDGFATLPEFTDALEQLARRLPVAEHTDVYSARRTGAAWRVDTSRGTLFADTVVAASGFQNVPRTPAFARDLPSDVAQLHVADYRRPEQVGDGVLVVGGGQSGLQIAEDLLGAGKRVFLATSRVGRMPRRFAGRDAFTWLRETGNLDLRRSEADPTAMAATPPQISGAGGGRTISYQGVARAGATLLGRATGSDGYRLTLAPDLGENVRFADAAADTFRSAWAKRAELVLRGAAAETDPADEPARELYDERGPAMLDLREARVSTVIWATGFAPSLGWLPEGALDERRRPQIPGLYVVGAPWLTHRSSANLYGMVTDAQLLAGALSRSRRAVAA